MSRIAYCLVLALLATVAWGARPAQAAEADTWVPTADEVRRVAVQQPSYANQRRRSWTFEASIPVWIPGVSGTFGEGGIEVEGDGGLGDMFDASSDLKFAFVGALAARHGPWTFAVDGFGARIGGNLDFKLTDGTLVDAEIGAIIATARVGYRVLTKPIPICGTRSCLEVDAYAGARFFYVDFEVTLPIGPKLDTSNDWVDPIVGLNAEWSIGRRFVVRAAGDIGGFGVGSDLAWWVVGGLEYRFTRVFSLTAGWAAMRADYSSGTGANEFKWNLTLSGPQLIATFDF